MRFGGRQKAAADDLRHRRDIRLSNREWLDLRVSAGAAGLRPAAYARRLLTGHHVQPAPSVENLKAWTELARLHSNINQIARAANEARKAGELAHTDFKQLAELLIAANEQTAELRSLLLGIAQEDIRVEEEEAEAAAFVSPPPEAGDDREHH